jgi:hypothetical protein
MCCLAAISPCTELHWHSCKMHATASCAACMPPVILCLASVVLYSSLRQSCNCLLRPGLHLDAAYIEG